MGGHGHHMPPVPDYKIYKVEGNRMMEGLEKRLAAKGLKDPWIRNEVWRYHPGFGTRGMHALKFFFRGLPTGIALTALTIAYDKMVGGGDNHSHGDHAQH